jgi:hypothetical protein
MCEFRNFLRTFYRKKEGKTGPNKLQNRVTILQRPKKRFGLRNVGQDLLYDFVFKISL